MTAIGVILQFLVACALIAVGIILVQVSRRKELSRFLEDTEQEPIRLLTGRGRRVSDAADGKMRYGLSVDALAAEDESPLTIQSGPTARRLERIDE